MNALDFIKKYGIENAIANITDTSNGADIQIAPEMIMKDLYDYIIAYQTVEWFGGVKQTQHFINGNQPLVDQNGATIQIDQLKGMLEKVIEING